MLYLAYCYARGTFQGLRLDEDNFRFHPWRGLSNENRPLAEAAAQEAHRNVWVENTVSALWLSFWAGVWFLRGGYIGRRYKESADPEEEACISAYIEAKYFPAGIDIPPRYRAAASAGFSHAMGVSVHLETEGDRLRFHLDPPKLFRVG